MTRNGEVDSAMVHDLFINLKPARGLGNFLFFIIAHAGKRRVGGAKSQEKISFESQPVRQRGFGCAAHETLNVSRRFRWMFRQMPGNLHRAIDGFTRDRFVDKTPGFGLASTEGIAHKTVPKRSRHANRARTPLRYACAL